LDRKETAESYNFHFIDQVHVEINYSTILATIQQYLSYLIQYLSYLMVIIELVIPSYSHMYNQMNTLLLVCYVLY
jgi:hypothetical protein